MVDDVAESKSKVSKKLKGIYGSNFPGFELPSKFPAKGIEWVEWLESRWQEQQKKMQDKRLHWSRHRHFKASNQWISSRDGRTWHEPRHDKNTIRAVLNLIGPALDYRLGVLREQRPGFRHEPLGTTTEAQEEAQAQQITVEYYFHVLKAWVIFQDAFQAAQTDGCAFVHVFKDKGKGEKKERVKAIPQDDERYEALKAQGYEVRDDGMLLLPLDEAGEEKAKGETAFQFREGDIAHRVVYAYETVADAEAKTVNGPYDKANWMIIRRIRDLEAARLETEDEKLEADTKSSEIDPMDSNPQTVAMQWSRGLPIYPTTRRSEQEGVYEYIIYFNGDVSEDVPEGAWRKVLGGKLIDGENELPGGVIPLAQVRDGSTDPELYPRPVMSDWIGDQVAINALYSMLLMQARLMGAGRIMVQKDTVLEETFSAVTGSMIEYQGVKPDFFTPPRASGDVWQLLEFAIKKLEDKHGWNDLARGQVSGSGSFQDVSGRAVLGAREMFERTLGPMVRASAAGVTEWSDLIVTYAQDLFDEPRLIPVLQGRPDLAKRIDRSNLGTRPVVFADPETMVPIPRALRNQMLFDLMEKGLIDQEEYFDRAPFAFIRDTFRGDTSQWARAQAINEVLLDRWEELRQMLEVNPLAVYQPEQGIPVLWDDDPKAHMKALLQIVLDDRKPWGLREVCMSRRNVYEDLAAAQAPPPTDNKGLPLPPELQQPPPPVPLEVIGAPASKQRAQAPEGAPKQPGAEADGQPGAPTAAVNPAPDIAGQGPAPEIPASPLGAFGEIERQAQEGGNQIPI